MSPRICLNMIVRNEIANLPRCLDSTVGHIHCAVIFDTGSTDGTVEYIRAHCKRHRIPCHITTGKFVDFEQARNRALAMAKHYHVGFDYILLMDADMELKVEGPLPAFLGCWEPQRLPEDPATPAGRGLPLRAAGRSGSASGGGS